MKRVWDLRALVIAVVVAAAAGALVDVTTEEVAAPASDIRAERGRFQTRASFCPPPFSRRLGTQTIAMAGDPGGDASIRIQPEETESSDLPEGRLLMYRVEGPPIEAVGYGSLIHASALLSMDKPVSGAAAARCPRVVSDKWYFPAGSSSLGYDERILVRNPFPDEAVVSVTFYTPTGTTTKANLAEVPVPAGESVYIPVNDFILRQPVLGASVTARRGRVVAWRALFAEPEDRPDGIYFGLGATSPSLEWYFPEGMVGDGVEQIFTLLNPNRRESIVTITLATPTDPLQPPKLVDVRVPPEAIKTISLPGSLSGRDQDLGGVGAIIESINGIGVIAERTVWYAAGRTGVESTIGMRETALQWVVPPAASSSVEDSLILLNPGGEPATVDITLLREKGGSIAPQTLQNLRIKPGTRLRIGVEDLTGGEATALLVTSDGPIAAERVASAGIGDVSSVLGSATRTAP